MKLENKKRVLVAMSGGVDSSVAAALLKKQGFNVSGVFMRLNNFSKKTEQDARKVAKKLNIPFFVWDFQKEFNKKVVEYFINEYQCGQTPNPCVECNKFIKFGILLALAIAVHNIPEGIAVAAPIFHVTQDSKKAIKYSFIAGMAEPFGAIIAYLIVKPYLNESFLSYIFAFVAGIMVYISFDELLPASFRDDHGHHAILGIITGMVIVSLSLLFL